jgi:hypothetical protein
MGGGYEQLPGTDPSAYGLIDPSGFSEDAFAGIQNLYNLGQTGLGQNADPFAAFIGQTPQLQDLTLGATSDLGRMLADQTRQFTQQAVQDVGQEFSGLGSLYSGAARDAAGQRATQAAGQAATALGQQQLGLFGNLANQAFQNQQRQQQLYAGLLGQGAGLGAQFGAPNYAAPQFAATPSFLDNLGQFAGIVGSGVGAAMGNPAAAAGLPGQIGGLFGGGSSRAIPGLGTQSNAPAFFTP